ncbi:chondroitinase-B domain-containing protein [Flavobacterium nackdongense]|uniref:T9SS type A sorting domain-containing protein n=1 Tax=Flavobacterium nackdongense TaxID=2547394 RepID=A0A4P6YB34_9FLAO|nr:chondroitinase-B domain-containing protein [Flavobacterium nackdongense]QBN17453.1 T9SS type A sorting domain-containing protein [Flavobacterium nackdongense]
MKNVNSLLFNIVLFLFTTIALAQLVSTNSALNTAISNAVPGTTIILTNGTWTNTQININKTGTAAQPITIKAETAGSVFFEGNSYVKMGGSYIVFQGVTFGNPSGLSISNNVITFKSSSECSYCQLTNVKIDSYNGTAADATNTFKWVLLYGNNNEISYCSFIGKYGVGSIINDNRDTNTPDYSKIHHNYFASRTPVGAVNDLNDQDAIRIGNSATSLYDSFTEVYDNYFYDFVGEIEVISNKSCHNKYYNNTFRDYSGTLTLRHGNDCEVFDNFFIANNKLFSGGVRVMGENHKIYNNYIEGVNAKKADGSTSNAVGGINVSNGRVSSALNGYMAVKNVTITNNTFVNGDFGLRIGTNVAGDLTIAPDNLVVANNLIVSSSSTAKAIEQITSPTGTSSKYEGNIKQNGSWNINTGTTNISVTSGLLATTKTDFYRIISGSTAIDKGFGTYSFLTQDITGGSRPTSFDVGAEEFNSGGSQVPYTSADVGVKVGFHGNATLGIAERNLDKQNLILYPVPVTNNVLYVHSKTNLGTFTIIDLQGKILKEETVNDTNAKIDLSNFSNGTYIINIRGTSKTFIK